MQGESGQEGAGRCPPPDNCKMWGELEGWGACKQVPVTRIKDLQQVGGKRAAPGARTGSGAGQTTPKPDLVRTAGEKPKIVRPKATTGIKSSEAVEETGWGEKNGFVFKNFV